MEGAEVVHVEVEQADTSAVRPSDLRARFEQRLAEGVAPSDVAASDADLRSHVARVRVDGSRGTPEGACTYEVHVHRMHEGGGEDDMGDDEGVSACRQWALPCRDFAGLWDSLVLEAGVKEDLLEYTRTAMLFGARGVDDAIVGCNRIVLLHGPPGTGKTTLCKALAQKLAIRYASTHPSSLIVEVNAHSLFSKWFSESGKLVARLFARIAELADDPESLVFVLIDEVESLTAARNSAMSGSEPSDAIRVVNAVLTQLDALKRRRNVTVLTTSNITGAIDVAFVDRADIRQYIGPPGEAARYAILASCVVELVRAGIVSAGGGDARDINIIPPFAEVVHASSHAQQGSSGAGALSSSSASSSLSSSSSGHHSAAPAPNSTETPPSAHLGHMLHAIAIASDGMSGRSLRKLPFLAHAYFVNRQGPVSVETFLNALSMTVARETSRAQVH